MAGLYDTVTITTPSEKHSILLNNIPAYKTAHSRELAKNNEMHHKNKHSKSQN